MDRMRRQAEQSPSEKGGSPSRIALSGAGSMISSTNQTPFDKLMQPSSSPRYQREDRIAVHDIKGAQSVTNHKAKLFSVRDHINVNDINDEGRVFKPKPFNKNEVLLTDEILGKKRYISKEYNPLEPKYVMSTKSRRMMVLGDIDGGKPRQHVKLEQRKDTGRYLRSDDIVGAAPKPHAGLPETALPELHPMFQDR